MAGNTHLQPSKCPRSTFRCQALVLWTMRKVPSHHHDCMFTLVPATQFGSIPRAILNFFFSSVRRSLLRLSAAPRSKCWLHSRLHTRTSKYEPSGEKESADAWYHEPSLLKKIVYFLFVNTGNWQMTLVQLFLHYRLPPILESCRITFHPIPSPCLLLNGSG